MMMDEQGKASIARFLEINKDSVSKARVNQINMTFASLLKGSEYKALEAEKNNLEVNVQTNFKNWNLLFIPLYARELGNAKSKFATELKGIYENENHMSKLEKNKPNFDVEGYLSESKILSKFSGIWNFSAIGLIAVLVLGFLGLVKYLFGERRTVIEMKKREIDSSDIKDGFYF